MTNIFSIEESNDKQLLGEKYVVRRISDETAEEQMQINKEAQKYSQGPAKSKVVSYIKMIAYFLGIGCVLVLFAQEGNIIDNVKTTLGTVCCLIGIVAFVVGIILQTRETKEFKVFQETIAKELRAKSLAIIEKSFKELGVPEDSLHLDTLFQTYRINDAVPASQNGSTFYNVSLCYFIEGDNLCIGNIEKVLSIPLSQIKGTKKTEEKRKFYGWNKPIPFNAGEFAPYAIKRTGFGFYTVSLIQTVKIFDGEDEYTIEILPYDAAKLDNLLNSTSEEN